VPEFAQKIAPALLMTWVGRGLGALVVTLVVLWVLRRLRTVMDAIVARFEAWLSRRGHGFAVRSVEVLSTDVLVRVVRSLTFALRVAASVSLFYVWLLAVSWALDRTHRIFSLVFDPLYAALAHVGSAFVDFLPNAAMLVVIFLVARFATRTVRVLTDAGAEGRIHIEWLSGDLAVPTRRIASLIVWVLALVIAFPYLPGSDSRAFQGISIVIGVLVSLGSSSVVANLLGGLVLIYTRAFKVGDRVRVGDVVGDVVSLGAFTTRIRSIKDEEIVLPNALVQGGVIRNYTRYADAAGVQVATQVTIGYEAPWRTVHRLLEAAARKTDGIVSLPAPYVLQRALDDFYVRYEICAYTKRPNDLHLVEARLCQNIQDEFAREGVEICSPHFRASRDGSARQLPSHDAASSGDKARADRPGRDAERAFPVSTSGTRTAFGAEEPLTEPGREPSRSGGR
jgi:small-conductance mechanosensitive channel